MNYKGLLSGIITLAATLSVLTACSDYDNGFREEELKYVADFKNLYGEIDANQDWNLAQRSYVVASTSTPSEVKIYALVDGTYSIVGDYKDVDGSQTLYMDIREDVESLLVTDGKKVFKTVPGGIVTFTGTEETRTVHSGNDFVTVYKITDENGETIKGVNNPKYKFATKTDIDAMKEIVPEIGHRTTFTNLNKVVHDFTYMSTGKFVIYPYYWHTSAYNTVGVYYLDQNGVRQEVDVYTIKEGSELMYENVADELAQTVISEEAEFNGWTIDNGEGGDHFHRNTWSTESDASGMKTPFIEYWRGTNNNLYNGRISKTFSGLEPGSYAVYMDVRLFNEGSKNNPSGVTAFANDVTSDFCAEGTKAIYNDKSAEVYYNNLCINCTVENDGQLTVGFDLQNVTGDWLAFKNIRIVKRGAWISTDNKGSFGDVVRGQGIVVDIPVGTRFGMYLRSTTDQSLCTFYSESELNNNPNICGYAVKDDGLNSANSVQLQTGENPCYASTFHVGDQMFFGFEDWPNTYNQSDFDLNDLVLAVDGCTPTIINEDPTPAATWLLACEDLGGSFDTDYNDVIFSIEHVSGQETATITALAAGGTLASYIFFEDPTSNADEICFGEIHQLFGAQPAVSGEYPPINVGASRGNAGQSITFPVSADWTMAHYVADNFKKASQYSKNGKECNMGGFAIYVLPEGEAPLQGKIYSTNSKFGDASVIAAPDEGDAPMMICLPYTYELGEYTYVWAWPRELCTIADGHGLGAYPKFAQWVNDYTKETDWYKSPYANTVSELKWKTATQSQYEEPVFNKQSGAFHTVWGQYVRPYGHYIGFDGWSGTTTDHTATIKTHYGAQFGVGLIDGATGKITVKGWNNGGTEANYDFNNANNTITINNVNKPGTIRITLYYAGDLNYEADEINYTFTVTETEYIRFTVANYAIAWLDGDLRLAEKDIDWNDPNHYPAGSPWSYLIKQYWEKEASNDGDYFYLYNLAEGKYLQVSGNNNYAFEIHDYQGGNPGGTQKAKFAINEGGQIFTKSWGSTRFIGLAGGSNQHHYNDILIPGQDAANGNVANWTMETITP